jgi:hypothetical protein
MPAVAAQLEESPHGRLRSMLGDVGPKLFLTLVAAGVSALLIPWITAKWQDHKQQLELRTTLASDMSRAYTGVIVTGRFVTGGLIYSGSDSGKADTAASQNAWTGALHDWLVESGTIAAQLEGRYPESSIAAEWRDFSAAVTGYMRIGSHVAAGKRQQLLSDARAFLAGTRLDWQALRREKAFKDDPRFREAYAALGAGLMGRGDEIVQQELRLSPRV